MDTHNLAILSATIDGGTRRTPKTKRIALLATAGMALCMHAPASAQATQANSNAVDSQARAQQGQDTGDIVVTARRKEESLSHVPISVTAIGAEQLKERAIHTEADLQSAVPGLIVRSAASPIATVFSIRGQTVEQFTGSTPAVLPYVNEVQVTPGGASSFFDLSSVQVLKGPQGTLFGRNTTGGAVLYSTTEPGHEFSGNLSVRAGNYNLMEATGAVDIPFSDRARLRLAFDIKNMDGYQHNLFNDSWLGSEHTKGGRATLVLEPTDRLENKTYVQYVHSNGHPTVNVLWSAYPCGAPGLTSTAGCLYNPASYPPEVWAAYLAAHPGRQAGGIQEALADQKRNGPYVANSASPLNFYRSKNFYGINTTTYQIGDNTKIKNIFGYSISNLDQASDVSGSPFNITNYITYGGKSGYITNTKSYSEEFQIQGTALGGNLDYTTGIYYVNTRLTNYLIINFLDVSPIVDPFVANYVFRTRAESEAVYAQGSYDLSSIVQGLKLSGGFRYTWERNSIAYPVFPGAVFGGQPSESKLFQKPSWQVGLDYQVTPQLLIYATHRGSWRSGGFNGSAASNPVPFEEGGNLFKPETTYDVEAGAKFHGRVMNKPTTFNIAVYNQWIHGVQRANDLAVEGGYVSLTANIPAAEVTGVEADLSIAFSRWFSLGGSLAYTHARYTDGFAEGGVYTFGPYGDSPRWSGSVYAMATLPTPKELGDLSFRVDAFAQSSFWFTNLGNTVDQDTKLPGYGLLNMRMDLAHVGGSDLTASFYVRNFLNKKYYTGGVPFGNSLGINGASPGQPRMFGGELSYKF